MAAPAASAAGAVAPIDDMIEDNTTVVIAANINTRMIMMNNQADKKNGNDDQMISIEMRTNQDDIVDKMNTYDKDYKMNNDKDNVESSGTIAASAASVDTHDDMRVSHATANTIEANNSQQRRNNEVKDMSTTATTARIDFQADIRRQPVIRPKKKKKKKKTIIDVIITASPANNKTIDEKPMSNDDVTNETKKEDKAKPAYATLLAYNPIDSIADLAGNNNSNNGKRIKSKKKKKAMDDDKMKSCMNDEIEEDDDKTIRTNNKASTLHARRKQAAKFGNQPRDAMDMIPSVAFVSTCQQVKDIEALTITSDATTAPCPQVKDIRRHEMDMTSSVAYVAPCQQVKDIEAPAITSATSAAPCPQVKDIRDHNIDTAIKLLTNKLDLKHNLDRDMMKALLISLNETSATNIDPCQQAQDKEMIKGTNNNNNITIPSTVEDNSNTDDFRPSRKQRRQIRKKLKRQERRQLEKHNRSINYDDPIRKKQKTQWKKAHREFKRIHSDSRYNKIPESEWQHIKGFTKWNKPIYSKSYRIAKQQNPENPYHRRNCGPPYYCVSVCICGRTQPVLPDPDPDPHHHPSQLPPIRLYDITDPIQLRQRIEAIKDPIKLIHIPKPTTDNALDSSQVPVQVLYSHKPTIQKKPPSDFIDYALPTSTSPSTTPSPDSQQHISRQLWARGGLISDLDFFHLANPSSIAQSPPRSPSTPYEELSLSRQQRHVEDNPPRLPYLKELLRVVSLRGAINISSIEADRPKHLIPGLFPFLLPSSSPGNLPLST